MVQVPVYRPEISLYERADDDPDAWVMKLDTQTATLFYPMPGERMAGDGPYRRTVERGDVPFATIEAPDGCSLATVSRAWYLVDPGGRKHDATNAVIMAKDGKNKLGLKYRPGPPDPSKPVVGPPAEWIPPSKREDAPGADEDPESAPEAAVVRPELATRPPESPPIPIPTPRPAARQASLFGDE